MINLENSNRVKHTFSCPESISSSEGKEKSGSLRKRKVTILTNSELKSEKPLSKSASSFRIRKTEWEFFVVDNEPQHNVSPIERKITRGFPGAKNNSSPLKSGFDHIGYQQLKKIQSPKLMVFNSRIENKLKGVVILNSFFSKEMINDLVESEIKNEVDCFFINHSKLPMSRFYLELNQNYFVITNRVSKTIKYKMTDWIFSKFSQFREEALKVLTQGMECFRTEMTDLLVDSLHIVTGRCDELLKAKYSINSEQLGSFTFLKLFISEKVKNRSVILLLLRVIHPEEKMALEILDRLVFWEGPTGYLELSNLVRIIGSLTFDQSKMYTWKMVSDESLYIDKELDKVRWKDVVDSFFRDNRCIYDVLQVNGKNVSDGDIEGPTELERKKKFYQNFSRLLCKKGLYKKADEKYIIKNVDKLLDLSSGVSDRHNELVKTIVGLDILWAGSICGWFITDNKFRSTFPLLFSEGLSTRRHGGVQCYIWIESEKRYTIEVVKSYYTAETLGCWHVEPSGSLQDFKLVSELKHYDNGRWVHRLYVMDANLKKLTPSQWFKLVNIMVNPMMPDGVDLKYKKAEEEICE